MCRCLACHTSVSPARAHGPALLQPPNTCTHRQLSRVTARTLASLARRRSGSLLHRPRTAPAPLGSCATHASASRLPREQRPYPRLRAPVRAHLRPCACCSCSGHESPLRAALPRYWPSPPEPLRSTHTPQPPAPALLRPLHSSSSVRSRPAPATAVAPLLGPPARSAPDHCRSPTTCAPAPCHSSRALTRTPSAPAARLLLHARTPPPRSNSRGPPAPASRCSARLGHCPAPTRPLSAAP
jgi:hypothetical protein